MGNSSLFDGRRNYFGRENYWHSNPVRDTRNVHDNYVEHNVDFGENQEGNLKSIALI